MEMEMAQVDFQINGNIKTILCDDGERMGEICARFCSSSFIDIKNVCFLYSGKIVEPKLKYSEIINIIDRLRNSMLIKVEEINNLNKADSIIKSQFPLCPLCKRDIKLEVKDYKINLSECKNNHCINIFIDEYELNRFIDLKKFVCSICKKSKYDTPDNLMYICTGCKVILCPFCKNIHYKNHNLIDFEMRNYICYNHNEKYISYCKTCKLNICSNCQKEHDNHDIISFLKISKNKKELLNIIDDLKKEKDKLNNNINEIINKSKDISENKDEINKLNNVQENIEIIYKIYSDMIEKYEEKYQNYQILMSINGIDDIIKDLKLINKDNNKESLMNVYEKMNNNNTDDEITMIYNMYNRVKIKILGKIFVEKYKNNCKIIYENKEYELTEEFDVKNIKKNKLEIKLKGIYNITSMESMFDECLFLESLPDISKWNTNKITDMSYIFFRCISLKYIADISKWDLSNVTNIQGMFYGCSALEHIPDISKWNTNKVIKMSHLFYGCILLKHIPDISKWDLSNVTTIEAMFYECKLLEELPDLSKWNTNKMNIFSFVFSECISLKSIPDISKWDLSNAERINCLFNECELLETLPDISVWNTTNVTDMSFLFYGCKSLKSLPNISKWNIQKLENKESMFDNCSKDIIIPKEFV